MKQNRTSARTLDVLELLSRADTALTLSEIINSLDIPKSSAFDIVQTLLARGFIEYENEKFKSLRLGLNCFNVGTSYLRSLDIYKESKPVLAELLALTNKVVFLATLNGTNIVYLDKLEPEAHINVSATLGSMKPAYCTALGKAIFSTMDDKEIFEHLPQEPYVQKTDQTPVNFTVLNIGIKFARENGFAIDRGECDPNVICIAAPVLNYTGRTIASISISGLTDDEDVLYSCGALLKDKAGKLSSKLGFMV